MNDRKGLLSIGEMSKLTGVGIQALRYYERKNILKPAYVDPDSGYRYYSINQVNFVTMIMNCVEFGIPLKELAGVIDSDDMTALGDFMKRGIKTINRKAKILKIAAEGFEKALRRIELVKQYEFGRIYQREFEEKIYHVKPCGQEIDEEHLISMLFEMARELYGENINNPSAIDNLDDLVPLPDVGYLCQYSPEGVSYYGFGEMSRQFTHGNIMIIPGGDFFFRQDERSQIEDACEIFKEQIQGMETFMVIETEEAMHGKTQVSRNMYELRLVPCSVKDV